MLRKEIRLGSKIGMRSKEAINNGFFADDDDVVSMVADFLHSKPSDNFFV